MFMKQSAAKIETPNTVLGKGVILEAAKLSGKESVRLEGMFRGLIDIEGSLILADSGHIVGNIHAKYALIAGQVSGNIQCDTVLHLASTAKVIGDVTSTALIVDEGGQLNGNYHIGAAAEPEPLTNETEN